MNSTSRTVLIFGREPAAILGLVAATIQAASAFLFHLSTNQQASLNTAASGVLALVVAFMVHDGIVAALTGAFQALVAAAVGFGLDWSADQQTAFMIFVVAVATAFVRTQVTAKVSREQLRLAA